MTSTRIPRAIQRLSKHSVQCMLITSLTNIRYLTGVNASSGLLLLTRNGATLFVDSRYSEMASKRAKDDFSVMDPSLLPSQIQRFKKIGFEPEYVTFARMDRWVNVLKNKKFVQIIGLIEGLRKIKDSTEMHAISSACLITKKALSRVGSFMRYGMTERQLAFELAAYCMKQGADGMAFDTIVAFGQNTSKPHHKPTNRVLKKGDIVQVDMGCTYDGYCSDYSRVYFTCHPSPNQLKAYRALKEAKKVAEKFLKPGVLNTKLDEVARGVLRLHGYDKEFSHSLGHGVGLDIHEGVTLSMKAPPVRLRKNEVVTIEPGLYFPGKFGMRIEDTRIVGHPDF